MPIAEDRTTVGKSSEPYRYMTQNEMMTKNRTAMDSATITQAANKETQRKKRVCFMVHLLVHPGCQQRDTEKEACVFHGALVGLPRLPTKRHRERSVRVSWCTCWFTQAANKETQRKKRVCFMVHLLVHPGCQQRDTEKEACVLHGALVGSPRLPTKRHRERSVCVAWCTCWFTQASGYGEALMYHVTW